MLLPDPSDFRLPDLRFVPVDRLIPHEREDSRRTGALAERFRESGILKNPPIVTPAGGERHDERYMVLDGANRVATAGAAGFPHLVVQVVPYAEPHVRLTTWHHGLSEFDPASLDRALAGISGLTLQRDQLGHARALLARRDAIAFVVHPDGAVQTMHGGNDLERRNTLLNAVVDLYRGRVPYHRVTRDSIEEARERYPDVTSLVVFPHFHPEEILEVARSGARLPAGITRHVIGWRALRVNLPLDRMADRSTPLDEKNGWLQAWMAERMARNQVRFYEESTVSFDE